MPRLGCIRELRAETGDFLTGSRRLGVILIALHSHGFDVGVARLVCELGLAQLERVRRQPNNGRDIIK